MNTNEQFDNMLEAQVEIEVYNPTMGTKLDKFRKLESHLRKAILNLRQRGESLDAHEIQDLIDGTANLLRMKVKHLFYDSLTPGPDGAPYLLYQATMNNVQLFIHVRAL